MTSILLYWNHICVLHRQEKAFLEDLAQRLRGDGIRLEVRYFGLGYPERMSEYLARPDAILPDLIVSADLEVFEDLRIFSKFKSNLYPAADWVPLRQSPMLNAVQRGPCLLPFVSIPLVYYTREPEACAKTSLPDWRGLAFGGINNSAAKTVVKSVWERWGQVAAAKLLGESLVADMPIGAFQAVRQGQTSTALVPSLYALRADGRETFLRVPQEGPITPSVHPLHGWNIFLMWISTGSIAPNCLPQSSLPTPDRNRRSFPFMVGKLLLFTSLQPLPGGHCLGNPEYPVPRVEHGLTDGGNRGEGRL